MTKVLMTRTVYQPLSVLAVRPTIRSPPPLDLSPAILLPRIRTNVFISPESRVISSMISGASSQQGQLLPITPIEYNAGPSSVYSPKLSIKLPIPLSNNVAIVSQPPPKSPYQKGYLLKPSIKPTYSAPRVTGMKSSSAILIPAK